MIACACASSSCRCNSHSLIIMMLSFARRCVVLAVVVLATACGDSSGPGQRGPGVRLIGGFNLTDTVSAKPTPALVVEVPERVD